MLTTHTHAAGGVCSSHLFSHYLTTLSLWLMRPSSHTTEQTNIRRVLRVLILALGLLTLIPAHISAQTFSDPGFVSDTIVTLPPYSTVGLTFAPGGRMFIWQKKGVVRIFKNGALLPNPFVDISSQVNTVTDRGLLGLALDPNFSSNGYVYLLYTYENAGNPNDSGPKTARLTRVTADPANPDLALQGSEVVLLGSIGTAPCSNYADGADCIGSDSDSHTIGTLRFAPDGKLFVGSGDGAPYSHADSLALRAQNLNSLNGKMLRINPDGTAPSDNPFYDGNPNSNRSKVYSYGLRNPYRFGLHPLTGEPFIGEVGWETWEELDSGRGANFGWPCYEGDAPQPDYQAQFTQCQQLAQSATTAPLFSYGTTTGSALIGGNFYTATQYPTQYRNNYFFADYTGAWIRRAVFDASNNIASVSIFATNVDGPVCLELGPDGSLYYVSLPTGEVRRIRYTSAPTAIASADVTSGYSPLAVSFSSAGSSDPNNSALSYLWEFGDGTTSADPNPTKTYTASGVKTFTAKLTVTNAQNVGSSVSITIVVGSRPPNATITAPADGATFPVGTVVTYQGTATDPDETLAPSVMNWSVLLHHDNHVHPHLTSTGPNASFVVESHGAGSYYYEITLTVTDSSGLKDTRRVNVNIAPSPSWPSQWVTQDIGSVGVAGSATYSNSTFTVKGSGADIWGTDDSFRYVYRPLSGNNQIIARVVGVQNTDPWAKTGVMIRETLNPDSRHASVYLTPGNGVAFQRRTSTGGTSTHTPGSSSATAPYWVRLARNGNTFTAHESADGLNWTLVGTDVINMASNVYIGLAVLSHDNSALCTATLEVTYNDVPPVITSASPPAFVNVNAPYNHTFTATGSPVPTFSVTAGSLPPGLTLTSSGLLSGAPTTPGTYAVTVTASNGAAPAATQSFGIKVNGAPVVLNDSYSTSQNTALTVSAPGVLGNDTDPNNDSFTASLIGSPAHGTVSFNAQGSFIYTPAVNFYGTDSFTYKASDGQLSSSNATVTITVNAGGTLAFGASAYTASEGDGAIQITVTRIDGSSGAATVNYSTGNATAIAGSDYTAASGTLSFATGETSKSFNITILNDSLNEPDETMGLTLSNVTGSATLGTPVNSVLTITDNDPIPTLSIADVSVTEGDSATSSAVFTVSLSAASARSITVGFQTADATADSSDYLATSGTLTFNPGETTKTIPVSVKGDTLNEVNESFFVNLSGATNATISDSQGVGTIINDDPPPTATFNDEAINEGASGTANAAVVVSLSSISSQVIAIDYATADGTAHAGSDYVNTTGRLSFQPGETIKIINVPVIGDTLFEGNESLSVNFSNPNPGALSLPLLKATITIHDDDGSPLISISNPNVGEGNAGTTNADFTVSLSVASGLPATVNYATADATAISGSDYLATSGTLTFNPGETIKTITVSINGDDAVEADETFTLALSNPTNAILSSPVGTGTILNDDVAGSLQFSAATYSFNEAAGAATVFLTRTGGSSGAVSANYTISNGTATAGQDYTASSGMITFASGDTIKSLTVALTDDNLFEGDETFSISLSNITGGASPGTPATAVVIIVENDPSPASLQFNQSSYNLPEGAGSIEINITRAGDKNIPVTVNYATTDAAAFLQNCNVINTAATSRCDYVGVLGTLHFAAGETSKTISIPIVDDTYAEGAESFFISLSNPTGGAVLGTNQRVTITIADNGNDSSGQSNPIDSQSFFVRQHYIDFLSREPDPLSAGWITILNQCGVGDQSCRLTVSQGIYGSPEFRDRGYFIYKFYSVALGRKPSYDEFNVDRARVSGFQTEAELEQSKVDFIADFMSRAEFANIYNGLSNNAYVQRLYDTAGVSQITVGGTVLNVAQMQGTMSAGKTRAQVLREMAESGEVSSRFQTESTVVMHYFGYLRRDPDGAYQQWINTLNSTGDSRNVTSGFINSAEYRARFGQ